MQRAVALALLVLAAAAVSVRADDVEAVADADTEVDASAAAGVDIELSTDASIGQMVDSDAELEGTRPHMIHPRGTSPRLITAATFKARGGHPDPIETSVLLIDDKPIVRLVRVEGELAGTNAEVNLQLNTVPKAIRKWLRRFLKGKFKRNRISIITRAPGTGTEHVPLQYNCYEYSGVLIRELSFPHLGKADGVLKLRLLYQKSKETKNVKQRVISERGSARLRTEFFKLKLTDKDGKSDKQGKKMAKAVFGIEPFRITRTGGFGRQDATPVAVRFRSSSDRSSALKQFTYWKTQPKLNGKEKDTTPNPKTRRGTLQLFYWSGASMDAMGGPETHGQLKPLLTLQLNDLAIDKLESGDGRATLKADSIDMTKL